jgi:tellurite resistance protein
MMSMLPLVEVAWADGEIDAKERQVLLEQSSALGIKQGTEAALFLSHWLDERPLPSWHQAWANYVGALTKVMKKADAERLKTDVLGRARLVAEASGGILGLGFAVSAAERTCLEQLAKAFD